MHMRSLKLHAVTKYSLSLLVISSVFKESSLLQTRRTTFLAKIVNPYTSECYKTGDVILGFM